MSTGSNIPPVTPNPAKPAGSSGQVVQIVTLPEALKNNARGVRMEGEVVGQNKDGSTRIKTSEGTIDVTIRGKQLQPGTKVEVDVPSGNPPRNVTIRPAPVAPQPVPQIPLPQTPVTQAPLPNVPVTQPPTNAQKPAPLPTTQPQQPIAQNPAQPTSLPAPAPTQATPPPLPSLPPIKTGDVVQILPLPQTPEATPDAPISVPAKDAVTKPVINPVPQLENAITQRPQSGIVTGLLQALKASLPQLLTPAFPNTAPQSQKPANTILPIAPQATIPSTPVTLPQALPLFAKIIAITSPTGQTMYATPDTLETPSIGAMPKPSATTPIIPAQIQIQPVTVSVTALTPQNQPVIPIPVNTTGAMQNFVIQSPIGTLPIGTQITLLPQTGMATVSTTTTTTPMTSSAPVVPTAWRPLLPFLQASALWPSMDDLFQSFYQATPQAAQIMGRVIPSPSNGANFGPALMLFAAAARAGDLQGWIGDKKLDMIHKLGKDNLVSRLSSEASSLARNNDLPATEWKSLPIPLLWQNEISKVLFHVRQEPRDDQKDGKDGATRFILDMSLPRMGDVQLDGTVNGKRLDVIIRTQMPISVSMQEHMKLAYAGALEGSDVFGELSFQGDLKNWMQVIKREEALEETA